MSKEKETSAIPGIIETGLKLKGGVGKIDKKAFEKNLPAGHTLAMYDDVDGYRDVFTAAVASELMDAVEQGTGNEEYSIVGVSLGGNTTVDFNAGPDSGLLITRSTNHSENVALVLERAREMYAGEKTKVEETADE